MTRPTADLSQVVRAGAGTPPSTEVSSATDSTEHHLVQRIKSEFLEMPGLRLTRPQAKRLWGLDDDSCSAALALLVDAQFLFETRDGAFMRIEHAQAKASLISARARPAVA
jgi:hypothetical protein